MKIVIVIIIIVGLLYYFWKSNNKKAIRFVRAAHYLIYLRDAEVTVEKANQMANSIDLLRLDPDSVQHYVKIAKTYSLIYDGRQLPVIKAAQVMGFRG